MSASYMVNPNRFVPSELTVDDDITLVQLQPEDAHDFYDLLDTNRDFLGKTVTHFAQYTRDEVVAEFEELVEPSPTNISYKIIHQNDVTGSVSLHEREGNVACLGYFLAESATGKGIATRSARQLVDFGFNDWGLDEVRLKIKARNKPSQQVARRLGASIIVQSELMADAKGNAAIYDIWSIEKC
jgi:ribosomal-protein-serine acetyltransferase